MDNIALPSTSIVHQLTSAGLPRSLLTVPHFKLSEQLAPAEYSSEYHKPKRVSVKTQQQQFQRVYESPLSNNYTLCISGNPNDVQAKLVAALLMYRAQSAYASASASAGSRKRALRNRSGPRWHMVDGAFADPFRDGRYDVSPSLLILSNITRDSSAVKMEKVRDLLEKYNQIPRIVVAAGINGIELFNTRLYLGLNYVINLSNRRVIKEYDI